MPPARTGPDFRYAATCSAGDGRQAPRAVCACVPQRQATKGSNDMSIRKGRSAMARRAGVVAAWVTIFAAAAMLGAGGKISAVLFLDFGEREDAVQKLLAKAADAFENDGAKRNEEEAEETKVFVFQKVAEDGDQKPHDAGAYFLKDSFLV